MTYRCIIRSKWLEALSRQTFFWKYLLWNLWTRWFAWLTYETWEL